MKQEEKRKNSRFLWLFTLLLFIASIAFAQGSGKSKTALLYERFRGIMKEMEEAYNNGDLNQVINLYKKHCSKGEDAKPGEEKREFKRLKRAIRADIYQWMALSYIALDNLEEADIFIRRLLVLRRDEGIDEYWFPVRDSARNKYYVAPRWLVGLKLGTNLTTAHPFNRYLIFESLTGTGGDPYKKDYGLHFNHSRGTQLGIIVEYALTQYLSLSLQPAVNTLRFQYKNSYKWKEITSNEPLTLKYTHRQKLSFMEIPILLKYQFLKSKSRIYIQVGGFYRLTTSAYKSIDINIQETEFLTKDTEKDVNIKEQISRSNLGLLVGSVVGFDVGNIRLEIEVNYKLAFNNIVNGDKRYENNELMSEYYDLFDDIKIRNWELSLNVLLPVSFKAFRR